MSRIRRDRLVAENNDRLNWESGWVVGWVLSQDSPDQKFSTLTKRFNDVTVRSRNVRGEGNIP